MTSSTETAPVPRLVIAVPQGPSGKTTVALGLAATLTIPDHHLGLIPRAEDDELVPAIEACRQAAEQHVDLAAPRLQSSGQSRLTHYRNCQR